VWFIQPETVIAMRLITIVVSSLLSLLPTIVLAQGSAEAGKTQFQTCAACHGTEAQGNADLKAPRLSHLQPQYIEQQLRNFREGIRGGEGSSEAAQQMGPMAASLPDAQAIADVAAYIGTLPGGRPPAKVNGDPVLGADYFNQFCGACHGAKAQGNVLMTAVAPTLAGASDWYLVTQLQAFQAGVRGVHKNDIGGRQMRPMSLLLPNEKVIEDVVTFIYGLGE